MMALIYNQQCYPHVAAVSAQANLRQQVKRSGRSQNLFHKMVCGLSREAKFEANLRRQVESRSQNHIEKGEQCLSLMVSAQANLRQQVKRHSRSQNHRLQKGLPA